MQKPQKNLSKEKSINKNNINSASKTWLQLINYLLSGETISPRGLETKEQICVGTKINMYEPMVNIKSRNIGERFRYAEAAWILSGDNRVSTIAPKVVDQLPYIIQTLKDDPYTRQAVLNIWRENPRKSNDVPCTLSLQFVIRNDTLNCLATMRSSDAWLGWVYDVFNFSMISLYVLLQLKSQHNLKYKLGSLFLTAGSQHLYKEQWDKAKICTEKSDYFEDTKSPVSLKNGEELIDYLWAKAKEISEKDKDQLILSGV